MPHLLEFDIRHQYHSLAGGIWILTTLAYGGKEIDCGAKLDSGAQYCVFRREVADDLEIEVEQGYRLMMDSPGGAVETYGHEVVLRTLGLSFTAMVFFATNPYFPRNLLGRNGWLTHLKLGIIDYEETIYLSLYSQSQP